MSLYKLPNQLGQPLNIAKQCQALITKMEACKKDNLPIGLKGPCLTPDEFLLFFETHELPFEFYVWGTNISHGDRSAYDLNIKTLQDFLAKIQTNENAACNQMINSIKDYESRGYGLGIDDFLKFFGARGLDYKMYFAIQGGGKYGNISAYADNVSIMQQYLKDLNSIKG